MLLQRLCEYAELRSDDMPPPMYQKKAVRYIIPLDRNGRFLGQIQDLSSKENKNGTPFVVPDLKRSVGIAPILLVDNSEYILGKVDLDKDKGSTAEKKERHVERVRQQHDEFKKLMESCSQELKIPALYAISDFLSSLDIETLHLQENFQPSANITFEVDGDFPFQLPEIQRYWAAKNSQTDDEDIAECIVCGEMKTPQRILAVSIKGILGGQTTGMAMISANSKAFESYGLESSRIAPICEVCADKFSNALNLLLRQEHTRLYIDPLTYIFWTRNQDFSQRFFNAFSTAKPEEVKEFLKAPWKGRPEAINISQEKFYAASLSPSGARVAVRDWLETTIEVVQHNLERYFQKQKIVDVNGDERYFSVSALARSTVRMGGKEKPAAHVVNTLLHSALRGDPLPEWILFQVVRRARAENQLTVSQAALLKLVLLSDPSNFLNKEENFMTEMEIDINNSGYLCGRLFAILESTQKAALGKINSTIRDRFYGSASSAPASVFGRLMRGAQPHLVKLRRDKQGLFLILEDQLTEVVSHLNTFPSTLNLHDQAWFALGFYHQKAADAKRIRIAKENKQVTAEDASEVIENDADQ